MKDYTNYIYPELHKKNEPGEEPEYPAECPCCGAAVENGRFDHYVGPVYECGGWYAYKPQIQNHTNKWWGSCPVKREKARKERGRVCDGCGSKRLEGTGFPVDSFGWVCSKCGHKHTPEREV